MEATAQHLQALQTQLEALQRENQHLTKLAAISRMLSSTLDFNQVLQIILDTAAESVGAESTSILLEDSRTGELYFAAATGTPVEELRKVKVPMDGSIAGSIYRTAQLQIVNEFEKDPRHFKGVDEKIEHVTRSLLGVPMMVRQRCIGVLEVVNKRVGLFTEEDARILTDLAMQAALAIENARLVARLREANQRLAELDKLKSDFISIASHELRTPLGLILGYAAFLREQVSADMGAQVEMVLRAATQLQNLIETMTNLSYLESGAMQLKREGLVLQDVVAEVVMEWRPMAENKHQTLRERYPTKPVRIFADRSMLNTIIANILHNAVKFTPNGGLIEVSIMPQTSYVAVSVSDTGPGIPKEYLEQIFEPFFQVEDHLTRHHEGLGLGLSVAKEMVNAHGGRIWAESVLGRGSRFTFTLPTRLESP